MLQLLMCAPLGAQVGGGGEGGGGEGGAPTAFVFFECDRVCVRFTGVPNVTNYWRFGDGTTANTPSSNFVFIDHCYKDANFYTMKWEHRTSLSDPWVAYEFPADNQAIYIGDGCGSVRKVSSLILTGLLPPNAINGVKIYSFGDLEADVNYQFNSCTFYVLPGSVVRVTNKQKLVLSGGTMQPHLLLNFACPQALWNGIEVFDGSELVTDGVSITQALFGISPIRVNKDSGFPKLNISSTIFHQNFIGIRGTQGRFNLLTFSGNTFSGAAIPNHISVKFCSGGTLPSDVSYNNWSYAGIYVDQTSLLTMPSAASGNNFTTLPAGIVCKGTNAIIRGCSFSNIVLEHLQTNLPFSEHGTAIIYVSSQNSPVLSVRGGSMENCDRGILADVSGPQPTIGISDVAMDLGEYGIEVRIKSGASGSYTNLKDNIITCSGSAGPLVYPGTTTGIKVNNTNSGSSTMLIDNNTVSVNHPLSDGFGIHVLNINPPAQSQSANSITANTVSLTHGREGILVENTVNASIGDNVINMPGEPVIGSGIHLINGTNAQIACNTITGSANGSDNNPKFGIWSESSENLQLTENTIDYFPYSVQLMGYHNTNCLIGGNDFTAIPAGQSNPNGKGRGLTYSNAITGPQNKTGNVWHGDFVHGALNFNANIFPYCHSRYIVSPIANVGPGTPNPVAVLNIDQNCNGWFEYENAAESAPGCDGTSAQRNGGANEADLLLASEGSAPLAAGWRWSGDMGLYRKFSEHPEWLAENTVLQNFVQSRSNSAVGKMYAVRNALANIPPELSGQYGSLKLAILEELSEDLSTVGFNSEALLEALSQLEQNEVSARQQAIEEWETTVNGLKNANATVNCNTQPCLNEQWLYGVYAETHLLRNRDMTESEAGQLRLLAATCAADGGPAVYLARSWHYLRTGERLTDPCANLLTNGIEERASVKSDLPINMSVQPNPAHTTALVIVPSSANGTRLQLTDLYSRLVYEVQLQEMEQVVSIPTASIPSGLYLIRLLDKSGKVTDRTKMVISH
jgi:hypothetical protein